MQDLVNKVVCMKLSTAETVVGKVVSVTEHSVQLKQPANIFVVPDETGQSTNLSIAPYAPFVVDEEVSVNSDNIIYVNLANNEIKSFYKQATGQPDIYTPENSGKIIGV